MKISNDWWIGSILTILGTIFGILISIYFYQRNVKDINKALLDGAALDIIRNLDKETYPQLFDSVRFVGSGQPWRKLTTRGIDQLFSNLLSFRDYKDFREFANLVNNTKACIDDFNDRVEIRNYSIFQGFQFVTSHNPKAYNYYQSEVLPSLIRLKEYIQKNNSRLISS